MDDRRTLDPPDVGRPAAGEAPDARPLEVPGPFGEPLTMASLPAPETRRWVVRRKAEVLAAIRGGLLTAAEACTRYRLSPEELELWQSALERDGVPGLRVTRIQIYRELEEQDMERSRRNTYGDTHETHMGGYHQGAER